MLVKFMNIHKDKNKKLKVLMISESFFPNDVRILQEANKIIESNNVIIFIVLKYGRQPFYEKCDNIKLYRLPTLNIFKESKQKSDSKGKIIRKIYLKLKGILGYATEYAYFTTASFALTFFLYFKEGFDIVHVHNPPDTLFVIGGFFRLLKKVFIYDHHDLSPDLYTVKYENNKGFIYRLLLLCEKLSCQTANCVIATNKSYKEIEVKRCKINKNKIVVVRNGPDLINIKRSVCEFSFRNKFKYILCYLGAINKQDGLEFLIEVFDKLIKKYNYHDAGLVIIGDGDYLYEIIKIAKEKSVYKKILFTGYVSDRKILNKYMSAADIFVDAAPNTFLNNNSTFIKHMEYMVFGKPIVSFKLKENMYTLKDSAVFIEPNDTDQMAKEILKLINNESKRLEYGRNAMKRVKDLSWEVVSQPLENLYKSLKKII